MTANGLQIGSALPRCQTTLIALLFATLLVVPARASSPDPDRFQLQVHVFERSVRRVKRFGAYKGEGKANLIEAGQINGIEFAYDCLYKFHSSEADEFYPARWKRQNETLDILMGELGSDTKTHTCELKIQRKDWVYRKIAGKLVTMSPQEYAPRHAILRGNGYTSPVVGERVITADYAPVPLGGEIFWMPSTIALRATSGKGTFHENVWSFQATYSNYHKLEVTSRILPDNWTSPQ